MQLSDEIISSSCGANVATTDCAGNELGRGGGGCGGSAGRQRRRENYIEGFDCVEGHSQTIPPRGRVVRVNYFFTAQFVELFLVVVAFRRYPINY